MQLEASLSLSFQWLFQGCLSPNFDQLNIALELLEKCLIEDKRILIVGDFDADGATASAVAIKALRSHGC